MAKESNIYKIVQKIHATKREIVLYEAAIERCREDVTTLIELYEQLKPKGPIPMHVDKGENTEGVLSKGPRSLFRIVESPERPDHAYRRTDCTIIEDSCKLVRVVDSPERPRRFSCFGL